MATAASPRTGAPNAIWKWARLPVWLMTHDRRPGVIILMYHCVGGQTSMNADMPAELFLRQLDYLRRRYQIVSLDEVVALAGAARAHDRHRIVLTFDDAHQGFHTHVFPALVRHRIPAIVYLPTAYVEEQRPFDWGGYARVPESARPKPMTWDQIREVAASGLISIGAHTHSHADLSQASGEVIQEELETSDALTDLRLGKRPRHFAYPFGRTSPAAQRLVAQSYDTAVLVGSARNVYRGINLQALRRVPVSAWEGYWFLRLKLGVLDAHTSPGFARAHAGEQT